MKKIGKVVGLALGVLVVLYGMFRLGVHVVQYPPAPHVKEGKIHIACVGDSITYGAGVLGHRRSQSYPAYLQENLGEKYQVLNYGLSGRTLMDEGDVPYRSEKLYQKSLDAKADIYLLMLGTNDAKDYQWDEDAYAKEIKDFVEAYQTAAPQAKIYLMHFLRKKTAVSSMAYRMRSSVGRCMRSSRTRQSRWASAILIFIS